MRSKFQVCAKSNTFLILGVWTTASEEEGGSGFVGDLGDISDVRQTEPKWMENATDVINSTNTVVLLTFRAR